MCLFAKTWGPDVVLVTGGSVWSSPSQDWAALQFASPSARGDHQIALAAMAQVWCVR